MSTMLALLTKLILISLAAALGGGEPDLVREPVYHHYCEVLDPARPEVDYTLTLAEVVHSGTKREVCFYAFIGEYSFWNGRNHFVVEEGIHPQYNAHIFGKAGQPGPVPWKSYWTGRSPTAAPDGRYEFVFTDRPDHWCAAHIRENYTFVDSKWTTVFILIL